MRKAKRICWDMRTVFGNEKGRETFSGIIKGERDLLGFLPGAALSEGAMEAPELAHDRADLPHG